MSRERKVIALTRMFDSYGQTATPSRLETYMDLIGHGEPEQVEEAIRDAMRECGDFPPGPGTVYRAMRAIRRERPGDPIELPRENGPRIGAGAQSAGALLSGIESRVERNYARVIARSKEIRAANQWPDTLDVRLHCLGLAEGELHYVEPRFACSCSPRCTDHEEKLRKTRDAVRDRLVAQGVIAA